MVSLLNRFEEKFIPEPNSGCWIWIGSVSGGYGDIRIGGKNYGAHRVSWDLYRNEDIGSRQVLHKCDVKTCVNPNHLFLGSQKDNIQDMIVKKRRPSFRGETNSSAVLTESDIHEIRLWLKRGSPQRRIARMYGVCQQTVCDIGSGRTWSHV